MNSSPDVLVRLCAAQAEEEKKWEGVPAWKKKLLEEKAAKDAAKMAPILEEQRREAERQAKLQQMPSWKRKLVTKNS